MTFEGLRRGQDMLGKFGAGAVRDRVVFSPESFENFEADWAVPARELKAGVILYLHGGSYVAGGLSYCRGFGGILADAAARNTLCAAYRLAPENPFPAALEDACAAYLRIRDKYPEDKIAIVGESAGGGLAVALACKLRESGEKAPSCVVCISPWADLSCGGATFTENADKDPCLFPDMLKKSAAAYAGDDTKNPLVSPVFADLSALCPLLIYAGGSEMLLDDARLLAENCVKFGTDAELRVTAGMWHAFVLFGTPESKAALKRICEFIDERLTA
jgi:acetyl esterase/lipase